MASHRAVSAFARVLQQSSRRSQWACSFVPQSSSVATGVGAGAVPTHARALGLQALRTQGWGTTAAAVSRRCIVTTVQPANEHTATFGAGAGGTRGAGDAGSRKKGPGSSQGSTSGSSKPAIIADVSIDYYTVLGVGRRATSEDIKSAYRTLGKQCCHCDSVPICVEANQLSYIHNAPWVVKIKCNHSQDPPSGLEQPAGCKLKLTPFR